MKAFGSFIALFVLFFCLPGAAQTSFEELEFEPDSVRVPYKPVGKNYVHIRSKRGTSGMNKTPAADAILTAEVTEIVLVFSETNPSDIAEREESNRERWENLLSTYPELFQYSTTYKNVCQCNNNGDSAAFKQKQGFYIYVNGDVPKVEEPKVASAPPPAAPVAPAATPAKTEPKKVVEEKKPEPVAPVSKVKETAPVETTPVKQKETAPVVEKTETPVAKQEKVKEPEAPVVSEPAEETPAEETAKPVVKKKPATMAKPRRSSDPKACRQPCYGYGDDDLNAFFKDNLTFTKKQRKKAKKWMANVKLQINYDGSIKKSFVTGPETDFNGMVETVLKGMNNWNCAVKNGLAVKSEVKFILKYDKETKSMKAFDMLINPRLGPKCKCMTDSEVFGSD